MGEPQENKNDKPKDREKRPKSRRGSGITPLSPAGSKIVSAFQEAIDGIRRAEPVG
jgi:hypothetical protein